MFSLDKRQEIVNMGCDHIRDSKVIYNRLQELRKKLKDKSTPVDNLKDIEDRCSILYSEYLYLVDTGNYLINYYSKSKNNNLTKMKPISKSSSNNIIDFDKTIYRNKSLCI